MVFELENSNSPEKSFARVQTLRNLFDKVITAKAYCAGDIEVVKFLLQIVDASSECRNSLKTEAVRLQGLIESSNVLQGRTRNALALVSSQLMS